MASATQIKELLKSHGQANDDRFYAVALQVAASEARAGHTKLAAEIRELVDKSQRSTNPHQVQSNVLHVARPKGEVADLLETVYVEVRTNDLILPDVLRDRVNRILIEQRNINTIREHNLNPRQRLLFTGPPGCGKTMTANAIGCELGLPLFVVRLDSLISKYLGDSLSKLRLIFEAAEQTRAIFFFDEFDSIGVSRDVMGEVGEMRRILNAFLLFVERLSSNSLIIAATNHGERLDKALYRRFDDLIEFGLPGKQQIKVVMKTRLKGVPISKLSWERILPAALGLSYSEITKACEEAVKSTLLNLRKSVTTSMLVDCLTERRLFLNH
jgi:SpoVK/Ycf46/Vps4 family AAA+-type ATPase